MKKSRLPQAKAGPWHNERNDKMTITRIYNNLYKMDADEGKVFALVDKSDVYGNVLYVPSEERVSSFIEITDAEGEEIKKNLADIHDTTLENVSSEL